MSDDAMHAPEKVFARIGAKTIIQREDGNILVLQRSEKTSRPHGWDFPGGGSDRGENPEDTVIRETREETGLHITSPKLCTIHTSINTADEYIVLVGYFVTIQGGEVQLSWEHDTFEWISADEAMKREWPEFHRELLEKFQQSLD